MPLCSLVVHPKFASLSSYEDGKVGGLSPKFIKLFGDVEYPETFLVHSLVFWEVDRVNVADDKASRRGDVTGFPLGGDPTGFISGDLLGVDCGGCFVFLSQKSLADGQ
jgi:hypothetical protein